MWFVEEKSKYLGAFHAAYEKRIPLEAELKLPLHLRIETIAIARAQPNLHASFGPTELAKELGMLEPSGELSRHVRDQIVRAIKKLIEWKRLDEASTLRCLVLPADTWGSGLKGYRTPCPSCTGKVSRVNRNFVVNNPVKGEALFNRLKDAKEKRWSEARRPTANVGPSDRKCRTADSVLVHAGQQSNIMDRNRFKEGVPV